ncbi:MAG: B12-binding domain-containing radical SAM protein [Planctomycetes bacterium]|nr:B12-binding domain-containing radical SAM protein [Planctomycetota bacterium]
MKVTFIKPNIGRLEHSLYVDEGRMEPLQLGVLAGLTPPDVECALYDDRIEEIPYDEPTDLAAITVEIYTARRAYEIAGEYRARGVPVVMGGFHPTLAPEECRQHADAIYLGDAEFLWHEVIDDARRGKLKEVYRARPGIPQPRGVQPRRDLFRDKGYLPITLMQFSRGCRFACDFCAISVFFNQTQFVRRTGEVLAEIENQDRRVIFFVDDNFLSNHEAAKLFLRELIPRRIRWVSQASIDMTNDPELMELLADSGCLGNVIGFESINPQNLQAMKKAPNLMRGNGVSRLQAGWDCYQRQCEILRNYHLQTWAAFTLGHDHDTPESIRRTYEFAMRNKFCFAAFNILMPYPGTPLYDRLKRENRLLWDGQWWLHPEYRFNHAAFVPRNMSPDELSEACWHCRRDWNKTSSIFKRLWDFKTHLSSLTRLGVYLKYNPVYAREAYKKQGMLFGLFRERQTGREPDRRSTARIASASATAVAATVSDPGDVMPRGAIQTKPEPQESGTT